MLLLLLVPGLMVKFVFVELVGVPAVDIGVVAAAVVVAGRGAAAAMKLRLLVTLTLKIPKHELKNCNLMKRILICRLTVGIRVPCFPKLP